MKFNRTDFLQLRAFSDQFTKALEEAGMPKGIKLDPVSYEPVGSVEEIVRNDIQRSMCDMFFVGHGWTTEEYRLAYRTYSAICSEVKNSENPKIVLELEELSKEYKTFIDENVLRKADNSVDMMASFQDPQFKKHVTDLVEKMGTLHDSMILSQEGEKLIQEKALDAGLGRSEDATAEALAMLEKVEAFGATIEGS